MIQVEVSLNLELKLLSRYMKHLIPLYHGTDARLLAMAKDERINFFSSTEKALDYLWEVFEPYYTNQIEKKLYYSDGSFRGVARETILESYKQKFVDAGMEDLYKKMLDALGVLNGKKHESKFYQYDYICASNSKERAAGYAYRAHAGGERGYCVYYLAKAIDFLGLPKFNPPAVVFESIEKIKDFAKEGKEKPVVVVIDDIYLEDCTLENGKSLGSLVKILVNSSCSQGSVRLPKGIDISKYGCEPLK